MFATVCQCRRVAEEAVARNYGRVWQGDAARIEIARARKKTEQSHAVGGELPVPDGLFCRMILPKSLHSASPCRWRSGMTEQMKGWYAWPQSRARRALFA